MENIKNERRTAPIPLSFVYNGKNYNGVAKPINASCNEDDICSELEVVLNAEFIGTIINGSNSKWTMKGAADQEFVNKIGDEIESWNN